MSFFGRGVEGRNSLSIVRIPGCQLCLGHHWKIRESVFSYSRKFGEDKEESSLLLEGFRRIGAQRMKHGPNPG